MQVLLKKSIDQHNSGNPLIERIRGVENLILARINYRREFRFTQGTVRIPIRRIEGQTECYHPYEFHLKFSDVQTCRELVDLRALATFAGLIGCNCTDLELAYALGAIGIPFDLEDIQIWRALLVAGRLEEALFFEKVTGVCYNCGKEGHFSNKCKQPKKNAPDKTNAKCFNCGRTGHFSKECKATKKNGRRPSKGHFKNKGGKFKKKKRMKKCE